MIARNSFSELVIDIIKILLERVLKYGKGTLIARNVSMIVFNVGNFCTIV